MTLRNVGSSFAAQVEQGAATLAAAEFVDGTAIRDRLEAFATAQRAYANAQHAVEAAEAALRAGQNIVEARCREQDTAVEALACTLVTDRESRRNPLAAFGMPSPSRIAKMGFADAAKIIHELAAAVQRSTVVSDATRQAAVTADRAAQAVEAELAPLQKLQANVRTTRAARVAARRPWQQALSVLKRCARIAADQGAPGLYEALFGVANRIKKKPPTNGAAPEPAAEVTPVPTQ